MLKTEKRDKLKLTFLWYLWISGMIFNSLCFRIKLGLAPALLF